MGTIDFNFSFWPHLLLLLNFCLALFVAITNRGKAQADELKSVKNGLHTDIQALGKQVCRHGERLAAIERDVENGLTKNDLSAVYDRVNTVASISDTMHGRLDELSKHMDKRMDSIDGHLLQLLRQNKHG